MTVTMKSEYLTAVLGLVLATAVHADQSYFHREESNTEVTLNYRWLDAFGSERNLTFALDKEKMSSQHKLNKSFKPEIAQRYVYIQLQKAAQKVNPREARIHFRRLNTEIQIQVKSQNDKVADKWMREMQIVQEQALTDYLKQNYYDRYIGPYGEQGVKPDHIRFVDDSVHTVLPAAQAIYEQINEDSTSRTYVNLLLSWVQSIPYDTLEDRLTSYGSGFSSPAEVLTSNRGDCDSKAVLTAALLRSLLPKLHMIIIYLPNHALLGANLPFYGESEVSVNEGGIDYVLLEPTGPAIMKIGELGEETERYINNGMYTYEVIPNRDLVNLARN
ncbi:MAG: transglutaminase domain-containing protein [Aestuariibacter sp.]